jgi:ribonuclease HI
MTIRPFPEKSKFRSKEFFGGPNLSTPFGYLVAHIDGGARGNPGPAGYGIVIEDEMGRPVEKLSEYLGTQTNNVAEYSGLVAAVEFATRHHFKAMKVYSDSELLVKQITGEYKVNNAALKQLHARALAFIDELEAFEIHHVKREQNREADLLANLAMDRGTGRSSNNVAQANASREVNGVVKNGVVEFLGTALPEGTFVKVRAAKP